MITNIRKASLSAVALISISVLTACSSPAGTVKPTPVSPTASATSSATPTQSASASATPNMTATPSSSAVPENTPDAEPAPVTDEPTPVTADKVTVTPDNLRIIDDGVESTIMYEDAPSSVIGSLSALIGSEPVYRYFDNEDCKLDISEYSWNSVTVSFAGKDTATREGFMIDVNNTAALPFELVTQSGIHIGDSLESAVASVGEDAPSLGINDEFVDDQSTFAALLDGYRGDVVTEKAVAEGTYIAFNDEIANRIASPYFLMADC